MEKIFWNDVASKGAILGVLMLVADIIQQSMMLNGNVARMGIAGVITIVVSILFIYLIYRFTKKHSMLYSPEEGFSYGKAFGYVLSISLFTSIIVGLGNYIFTHLIIGYSEYIDGLVKMYSNVISTFPMPAQSANIYEQMLEQITSQPEPGIMATIFSSLWSYILLGGFVGLFVAAAVKREPNIFGNENE